MSEQMITGGRKPGKRWRKSRDFDVLIVEVPKAMVERVRAAIVDLGGRIR